MGAVDVGIAQHHRERLVAADPLHGRQIDPGLHEFGNRGVPHDVRCHQLGIEPRNFDRFSKRTLHMRPMPSCAVGMR